MRQVFRPGGWQTVLVLLSAPTLLWLGFWQLERADMKETRLAEFAERAAAPPLQLADLAPDDRPDPLYWRRARGTGEYRPPLILLDNRIRSGRVGYEVLQAFEFEGGGSVLVNRGWIPAPDDRGTPPALDWPPASRTTTGRVGPPPTVGITLAETEPERLAADLLRVQRIDLTALAARLDRRLLPFVLYLDDEAEGGYARQWPPPAMEVDRHYAYAVQWFAFTAIALGIYAFHGRRRAVRGAGGG